MLIMRTERGVDLRPSEKGTDVRLLMVITDTGRYWEVD